MLSVLDLHPMLGAASLIRSDRALRRGKPSQTDWPHLPNTGCPGARSERWASLAEARCTQGRGLASSRPFVDPPKSREECHERCDNRRDSEEYEGGLVAVPLIPHERVSSHCGVRNQWFGLARLPGADGAAPRAGKPERPLPTASIPDQQRCS